MELTGRYNTAKIFTENIEYACIDQIKGILDCAAFEDAKIRIMPDCHAGKGCVVGYTQTIEDKIVPNLVGVDISCGMSYVKIKASELDFRKLDKVIRTYVPSGMSIHKPGALPKQTVKKAESLISSLHASVTDEKAMHAVNSVGTLGGGNHFIEAARSKETGDCYLIVHSGSRNLGLQVCKYWQQKALNSMPNKTGEKIAEAIKELKEQGRAAEIEQTVKQLKKQFYIPKDLAYLDGEDMEGYLRDVGIVAKYADLNRRTMLEIILGKMGILHHKMEIRTTCHNYIDLNRRIVRKGAVSAEAGEEILVPLNMRDGSLLCTGLGNPDWNWSAPHGAGRVMSRSAAKKELSMEEFRKTMKDVYTTSVSEATLDEAPMAYKPAREIEELLKDTAEIREHLLPMYNFKAS